MNQYAKERAALKVRYRKGQMTKAAYDLEMCLIACDERQDPAACIECMKCQEAGAKRRKVRSSKS